MSDAGVTFSASPWSIARFPPPFVAAIVVVFALGQGSSARAENDRETARLVYVVAANASGCPDEESFRNLVTARLGYDPFQPDGKHAAAVRSRATRAACAPRHGSPGRGNPSRACESSPEGWASAKR